MFVGAKVLDVNLSFSGCKLIKKKFKVMYSLLYIFDCI